MFDEYAVDDVLELSYGRGRTFLALTLLYEENGWGTMTYHQDHIFPQSLFNVKGLVEAGINQERIDFYFSKMNCIGNLELLLAHENEAKLNKPFDEWIATRDEGFKKRHLIPENPDLWKLERFDDFIKSREKLITDRLMKLFSVDSYNYGGVR